MEEKLPIYRLVFVAGGPKRAAYVLAAPSIGLGRDEDNLIQVDDNFVSRHHAVFVRNCNGYIVRDLDSRNSTYVNDSPAHETPLKPGDRIRCGGVEFQYEAVPEAESPEAGRLAELIRENAALSSEVATAREKLLEQQRQSAERETVERERVAYVAAERQKLLTELAAVRRQLVEQQQQNAKSEAAQHEQLAHADAERLRLVAELADAREASTNPKEFADPRRQLLGYDAEFARWQATAADAVHRIRQAVGKFRNLQAKRKVTPGEFQECLARLTHATNQLLEAQVLLAAKRQPTSCDLPAGNGMGTALVEADGEPSYHLTPARNHLTEAFDD